MTAPENWASTVEEAVGLLPPLPRCPTCGEHPVVVVGVVAAVSFAPEPDPDVMTYGVATVTFDLSELGDFGRADIACQCGAPAAIPNPERWTDEDVAAAKAWARRVGDSAEPSVDVNL
jgi:hypothetical protein